MVQITVLLNEQKILCIDLLVWGSQPAPFSNMVQPVAWVWDRTISYQWQMGQCFWENLFGKSLFGIWNKYVQLQLRLSLTFGEGGVKNRAVRSNTFCFQQWCLCGVCFLYHSGLNAILIKCRHFYETTETLFGHTLY